MIDYIDPINDELHKSELFSQMIQKVYLKMARAVLAHCYLLYILASRYGMKRR